jgi:hypothetical protein
MIIQTLSAQKLSHGIDDDDVEVASTSIRLPLDCPAMRVRMRFPGRATTCKHVHCFDLDGYLLMNEKKPSKFEKINFINNEFFFQRGFVQFVINQRYIQIYFSINSFLILSVNVQQM